MHYLLYLILPFLFTTDPVPASQDVAEEIHWITWDEAVKLNASNPKKVFVDVYTDWCGWCKRMDATTFKDPKVVEYISNNYYAVKLDAEQKDDIVFQGNTFKWIAAGRNGIHQLAYALLDGKMSYPSYVTLDESFARILISPGYKQVDGLMKELVYANEEKYKTMTFAEFQKAR
ncbi:MAG: DUF255 domain-containing protein [Saprospiraceae bacterium]|nr:DUF255 domain-containing protein [Saprospiraceae bacterium]HPG05407.1 DUF255 domain-containing protein [Saprospiraceae bacterium]